MSTARTVGVGLLAFLIVLSAGVANAAIATDRTVLDSGHISDTFQEEDVYADLISEAQETIEEEVDEEAEASGRPEGVTIDTAGILDNVLTEDYVAQQVERNLDLFLDFARGDTETLELWIDIREIKDRISVSGEHIDIDTGTLARSADLDSQQYDVRVSADIVARLNADETGYAGARQEVRETVEEEAGEFGTDDALVALNQELKQQAAENTQTELAGEVSQETIRRTIGLQHVVIDGLTDPELDNYDQYTQQREAAEQNLESALAGEINDRLETELDDEIRFGDDVREELDDDDLSLVESGLTGIDTATWLLPLLVLVFAGGILGLTRSARDTVSKTGVALAITGVIGVLVGFGASGVITSAIEDAAEPDGEDQAQTVFEGVLAVFDSLFNTYGLQSVYLTVLGIGLFGIVYVERKGYLGGVKDTVGIDGSQSRTDPQAQQGQGPPEQTGKPQPSQAQQPPAQPEQGQPTQQPGQQGGQPAGGSAQPPNQPGQHAKQGQPPVGQGRHPAENVDPHAGPDQPPEEGGQPPAEEPDQPPTDKQEKAGEPGGDEADGPPAGNEQSPTEEPGESQGPASEDSPGQEESSEDQGPASEESDEHSGGDA
jgi:hypothetical protein